MSTDATGLPSPGAHTVSRSLDSAVETAVTAGTRTVRSLDDRLTILAVRMAYVAFSFFFACFYFAQVYLQLVNENGMWLPSGVNHPPTWLGVAEVALVIGAGLVYFWGQWGGLYRRDFAKLHLALWTATFFALAAFGLHIYELHAPGFALQGGGYVSVFIALEGVFTGLLGLTVLAMLGLSNRARLGRFRQSGIAIEAFGEFFGWLSAIALLNFLALYVQPFFPAAG